MKSHEVQPFSSQQTCPATLLQKAAPAACHVAGELEVVASGAGPITCRIPWEKMPESHGKIMKKVMENSLEQLPGTTIRTTRLEAKTLENPNFPRLVLIIAPMNCHFHCCGIRCGTQPGRGS